MNMQKIAKIMLRRMSHDCIPITSGKAIKAAGHMPTHIYNAYTVLNNTAGLLGLEITGIRDKKTKKEWKRGG